MYDLIGDIHGSADELERLLHTLGYRKTGGAYRHPERKVIFLGDFIDRGPKIRQVLEIARSMVSEETALAVLGNHELNALAFHTEDPDRPDVFLRKRSIKNLRQYGQTLLQLNDVQLHEALDWFRTLPLWLDLEGLRVVHACWDDRVITEVAAALKEHRGLTPALVQAACKEGKGLFRQVAILLKGKEATLPTGLEYADKDGQLRSKIRTRWYLPPDGHTYGSYVFQSEPLDCDAEIESSAVETALAYPSTEKPVFIGHYGLRADRPQILTDNVACVDYSMGKGGFLVAYRWNGEQTLRDDNFVWHNK